MGTEIRVAALCAAIALCVAPRNAAKQAGSPDSTAIACRVMEAHTNASPAATVIVFHQQHREDQQRLGDLLQAHSGESVEIQSGDGGWTNVTIFRLKSCFGRGLMVLPPGGLVLKDGSTFELRLPATNGKN